MFYLPVCLHLDALLVYFPFYIWILTAHPWNFESITMKMDEWLVSWIKKTMAVCFIKDSKCEETETFPEVTVLCWQDSLCSWWISTGMLLVCWRSTMGIVLLYQYVLFPSWRVEWECIPPFLFTQCFVLKISFAQQVSHQVTLKLFQKMSHFLIKE